LLSENVNIKIYTAAICVLFLYGYETWSFVLREEYRLRFSENVIPREIFGPNTVEVAGDWKRLRNEELHDLYSSIIFIG
jgi:hypothetical protein